MTTVADEFPHLSTADPVVLMDRMTELNKTLTALDTATVPSEQELRWLRELAYIAGILRRRTAGPPKKSKTPGGAKPKPSIDDVLSAL